MNKAALTLVSLLLAAACAAEGTGGTTAVPTDELPLEGKGDSSVVATFLDFRFTGQLVTDSTWGARRLIEDQMLYTVGQLNGEDSVGRLDRLDVDVTDTESTADGRYLVTYDAQLPVAWGRRSSVPTTYEFILPRDVTWSGQSTFTEKYSHDCVDWSAHDVDSGSMWYYYRPNRSRCRIDDEDVFRVEATVTQSAIETTGKFPEYDMVWEDETFRVVAVFGKYEDGATSNSDAGIAAYNTFLRRIRAELETHELETTPAEVPSNPGVSEPDVTFEAILPDGRMVEVVALLVDNVRTAGRTFDERYGELSSRADLIAYNGHAGLGANIRALARKGEWVRGQYAIVFMNGCDTYAYVDSALADAHARVNPDDETGTKYLDIVTNAMPAYFRSTADATMALVRGMLSYEEPMTYEQIFRNVDRSQVVLVSGEEDNEFVPGGGGEEPPPEGWEGLEADGNVAADEEHRWETPVLAEGSYLFEMTGTRDADLYVRVGMAPTTRSFDCRPYKASSDEICRVDLTTPAAIHVMVRGWASDSSYTLVGRAE